MRKRSFNCVILTVSLAAMILAGCGAASGSSSSTSSAVTMNAMDTGTYSESASEDSVASSAGFAAASAYSADDSYGNDSSSSDSASDDAAAAVSDDDTAQDIQKKIIYTADVSVQTNDYDTARSQLTDLISQYDGFVESSSEYDNGSDTVRERSYYVTAKIPSKDFDSFMTGISTLSGKVTSQNITSDDMTRTYSDNADRIEALETEQETLLELLAKADSVDSMIAIQKELTDVRAELAQLHHANSGIDYNVQYSTVNISLEEVASYEPERITFGERIRNAFGESGASFVDFLQNLLVAIIFLLPYIILIIVIVLIIRRIIRKRKLKKGQARKKGQKQEDEQKQS